MKKIFLHIGCEKTGTTSIQRFLYKNRKKLYDSSYGYLGCLGENAKSLAACGMPLNSKDICVTSCRNKNNELETEASIKEYNNTIENQIKDEISRYNFENLIISSEDFWRLDNSIDVKKIIEILSKFTDEIKIIAYLRRQDFIAVSRYYSLVLGGSKQKIVLPKIKQNFYCYDHKLNLWSEFVGKENIIIRKYKEKEGFNSIEDFTSIFPDINFKNFSDKKTRIHFSLDPVNQILLSYLNDYLDKKSIENIMSEMLILNEKNLSPIISSNQAKNFVLLYKENNKNLCNIYNLNEDYFSKNYSMYSKINNGLIFKGEALKRLSYIYSKELN